MYSYSPLEDEDADITLTTISNSDTNVIFIWLDEEALNSTSPNTRLITNMFKTLVGANYYLYDNSDLFLTEIENLIKTRKTIVIMSGRFAENILSNLSVSLLREILSIFIFCHNSDNYKYLLKKCRKLIDICTDEQSLKEAIEYELYPSTNFLIMDKDLKPIFSLKDNSEQFDLYKQYIKLLQQYPWSSDNREKMLKECLKYYRKNNAQRRKIEEFKYDYTPETAIRWYTRDSFLYRLVNKALRSLDMEQISIYRPFIRDLCKQLERLHKQNQSDTPLTVFRGHGNMTIHQLNKIKENIGTLISFNGFLSTSTDYNVAIIFAGSSSNENKSVLFEIRTNYGLENVIFADVSQFSDMENEKEVLFSLCSIFRIDDVIDDEENQLSKLIMSATDEHVLNISQNINNEIIQPKQNFLSCCQRRYLIAAFATLIFILITIFVVILSINIKSKDVYTSNSYDCIGFNCSTTSATTSLISLNHHSTLTTETHATKNTESSISTTLIANNLTSSTYVNRLNESKTSSSQYCFSVGWKSDGDVIISGRNYRNFAVDDDFNVYVQDFTDMSLQKWSSDGELIQRYFQGSLMSITPLFFHSSSRSLYFCYEWKGPVGIYKLNDNYSKPVSVVNDTLLWDITQYQMSSKCTGLYVNSIGDIFMFSMGDREIIKWTVNSPAWILVASVNQFDSPTGSSGPIEHFAIDEINRMIYTMSLRGPQIVKYKYGSTKGTVIFDETIQQEIFSDTLSSYTYGRALIMDKTGNILFGTSEKISLLTTDGKFNVTVLKEYKTPKDRTKLRIQANKMAFDKLGNLYVLDMSSRILKFNRTSSTCINNIYENL